MAAQETTDPAVEASQQLSRAEKLFLLGENQKALETYRKARELFLAAADPLGQGYAWEGEAGVHFRLGDDQKALEAYRTARELFLAAGDQLGQGETWRGEAEVLFRLGEDQKALDACSTARQLLRAARQHLVTREQLKLAHTWYGEAEILFRLGEKDTQALYAYRNARQRYLAAGSKLGQANTWIGEADVLLRLGENQKALDAYKKARQLFTAVDDQEGQGDTWFGEALARISIARNVRAQAAAADAAAMYQTTGAVSKQISALLLKAEAAVAAEGVAAKTNTPFIAPSVWLGWRNPGARASGEAIRLHSQWRGTGIADNDRTEREELISQAYDFLVPLRARQRGQAVEALRLAEEARSRVFLDLLAIPPDLAENSPADLVAERQRLETEIWRIEEQLRGSPTLDQQEELLLRRHQLDQELEWNRYQRIAAQEEPFPQEPPLDTAAIQALSRETGPLLLYYATASEVWGFLILPETAEIYRRSIAISWSDLKQQIRAFTHDLANPLYERSAGAEALRLWSLLIDPFLDRLPNSGPLVLVPHGPLHELPFEALRDKEAKPLFERWQISITPSASALAFARRRHVAPSPDDSFLGFSSGRGLNLPSGEVAEISGFFGTDETAFHPTEANYRNYVELVAQARHLLIATRGVHVEGSRTETYLEIEPTPEVHDSRLTAAEIATIPLKAELVTLAACDTSHGRALLSDERLDLTRSFLIARAAAVLATRWKVPEDASTSRFLTDFYRAYRRGGPQGTGMRKDEALTEARRRSRERGDPAQVWAAWVLVEDAR